MIHIEIDTRQVSEALDRLQRHTGNLNPALDEIGAHIASEVALNFRDTQDPYGNPWPELSSVTIAKRRNHSDKPLNDTDLLKSKFRVKL